MRQKSIKTALTPLLSAVLLAFSITVAAQENPDDYVLLNSLLKDNPKTSIFYSALEATHLTDSISKFIDYTYPQPQFDSTYACLELTGTVAIHYSTGYQNYENGQYQRVVWPEQRLFKYTVFVVNDSVLQRVYGIRTLNDLRAKARTVYPEGASLDDSDINSSLYKLMSYHILPCWLPRHLLNYTDRYVINDYMNACPDSIDMADFYETLHPYAIMRISTPYDRATGYNGKYAFINRKGTVSAGNLEAEGIRIWNPRESAGDWSSMEAVNGGYHYIDSLLLFNQATKNALHTRIRVMSTTLSPDFINSGARGRMRQTLGNIPTTFAVYSFKNGFCKNVTINNSQTMFAVRYQDREWDCYYDEEITIRGLFDITFRLPPVPESGLYEIRVSGVAASEPRFRDMNGTVLYYIRKGNQEYVPCNTPVDLTLFPTDPRIGYISDLDLLDSESSLENDNAMRKRGYMKAPDSFAKGSGIGDRMRNHENCYRKIVCEIYMEAGQDYYLRLRQLSGDLSSLLPLNYIEIVPYSIYSGQNGPEDKH